MIKAHDLRKSVRMTVLLHHLCDHRPAVREPCVLRMYEHRSFMHITSDDEADTVRAAAADRINRAYRHKIILNRAGKEHARIFILLSRRHVLIADKEQSGILDAEPRQILLRPVHALKEQVDILAGGLMCHHAVRKPALCDRLCKSAFHARARKHIDDRSAAGRLAEDRDAGEISAKGLNILMDPVHGHDLVGQSAVGIKVLTARIGREIIESEDICPVVERKEQDPVTGKCFPAVHFVRRIACVITAPVNVDHDRKVLALTRPLHIYGQAVFVTDDIPVIVLDRCRTVFFCVIYFVPCVMKDASLEAKRSYRRFGIWDAKILDHSVSLISSDFSKCSLNNILHFRCSFLIILSTGNCESLNPLHFDPLRRETSAPRKFLTDLQKIRL